MSKNSKKITIVNPVKPPESLDKPVVVDNDIQASKQQPSNQIVETPVPVVEKKKRVVPPRTEAQKAALAQGRQKGRETLNAKNAKAQAEKEDMQRRLDEEKQRVELLSKELFEAKIVKKAVSVKKKQIKRDAVLDEISDDETPIDQVKQLQKQKQAKRPQPQPQPQPTNAPTRPKFIFV